MASIAPAPRTPSQDWIIWQLADSALPTGSFAHSGGLEAAWQHGEIKNSADLCDFLETSILQAARAAIPFVGAAFDEPESFAELNQTCDAFLSNHVAKRASRAQGRALLACVAHAFPNSSIIAGEVLSLEMQPHFAVAFGVVTVALGIEKSSALRLFMFTLLRGWISSAVRLGIIGPLQGQTMQNQLSVRAEEALENCLSLSVHQIAQTAPLLDLFQGAQDRLYSRLFQS